MWGGCGEDVGRMRYSHVIIMGYYIHVIIQFIPACSLIPYYMYHHCYTVDQKIFRGRNFHGLTFHIKIFLKTDDPKY